MSIYVALIFFGNLSESPVTLNTFCVNNCLVIVYLIGFAMAGSTVNSLGFVDCCKAAARRTERRFCRIECLLT
jgi:hypothetical protein